MAHHPLVSIVMPVYNESGNLEELHNQLSALADGLPDYRFEFIFVNDGSRDSSATILNRLADQDERIQAIHFSRNFGQQMALTAGLDLAEGDAVITMDSDLQDPPAVCADLIAQWKAGYQIVYAQRLHRAGETIFKRVTSKLYYRLLNRASATEIPRDIGDFRLLDRQAVDELSKFREHQRFMRGLVGYLGFRHTVVQFDRPARFAGKTHYSFQQMWRLAFDGITSFSTVPLQFIARMGYTVSFLSLVGIIYAFALRVWAPERTVPGWAFVTIAIFFIGGIQLVMLGLLGSYIGRIYTESQDRPLYIIESVYRRQK
jgi:dolichol-phosphate mannosyltransferase